jgi:hypothetical protein
VGQGHALPGFWASHFPFTVSPGSSTGCASGIKRRLAGHGPAPRGAQSLKTKWHWTESLCH